MNIPLSNLLLSTILLTSCAGSYKPKDALGLPVKDVYVWYYDHLVPRELKEEMIDSLQIYLSEAENIECEWRDRRDNIRFIAVHLILENDDIVELTAYENSRYGHYIDYCLVDYFCPKINRYLLKILKIDPANPVNDAPCQLLKST